MQRTAAAKGHESKAFGVKTPFNRDQAKRPCHPAVGDTQDHLCRLQRIEFQRLANMFKDRLFSGINIKAGQFAANRVVRVDAAQHNIRIRHSGPCVALTIGHRTGRRSCAFGANVQQTTFVDPCD